ncbi:MAG: hypothetical protein QM811_26915 [Pirellulales bacterium]
MTRRRLLLTLATLLACGFVWYFVYPPVSDYFDKLPDGRDPVLVTIGPETTRIVEPLTKSGYPDYVAALNIAESRGADPHDNLVIPLLRVAGPVELDAEQLEFYARLKIPPLPKSGAYLVPWHVYVDTLSKPVPIEGAEDPLTPEAIPSNAASERLSTLLDEVDRDLWTEEERRIVDAWLDAQESALAALEDVESKTSYYAPYTTSDDDRFMMRVLLPVTGNLRRVCETLKERASARAERGDFDGAWSDLRKILHISNVAARPKLIVERLVASACRGYAYDALARVVVDPRLDAATLARMRTEFRALTPPLTYRDCYDQAERFAFLDVVRLYAEYGYRYALDQMGPQAKQPIAKAPMSERRRLDYDEMLRNANAHFDRIVAVWDIPDHAGRMAAMTVVTDELQTSTRELEDWRTKLAAPFVTRATRTHNAYLILRNLMTPAVLSVLQAETKLALRRDMLDTAFALALYRKRHEKFPATLADLMPEFLPAVPLDPFVGRSLTYRTDGRGFFLAGDGQYDPTGNSGNPDAAPPIATPDFYPQRRVPETLDHAVDPDTQSTNP